MTSALRRAVKRKSAHLENLIKYCEHMAGFAAEDVLYVVNIRHHHQWTLTSNQFVGSGVVGGRVRMPIKQLVEFCLRSRGLNSLDDVYVSLSDPVSIILS